MLELIIHMNVCFKFKPGGQERHRVRDGSRPWQGAEAGRRRDLNGPQSKDLGSEKNLFDVNISISIMGLSMEMQRVTLRDLGLQKNLF